MSQAASPAGSEKAAAACSAAPTAAPAATSAAIPGEPAATSAAASAAEVNSIDDRLFPPHARRGSQCGQLKLGTAGVRATDLLSEFGSPLYVVDEDAFRAKAREVRDALTTAAAGIGTSAKVYYAGKAFLCVEVARWIADEGLCLDVASGGELAVALAAGFPAARIGFHGNNKSACEIAQAVQAEVGTIILDSRVEIARVAQAAADAGVRQSVRLRVNSGVHAGAHSFLATAHEDQKFGVPLTQAPELVREIVQHPELDFRGLHCHIGSQIFGDAGFRESARRLLSVYRELGEIVGSPLPELNLGGGFGIAYTEEQLAEVLPVTEIAQGICRAVAEEAQAAGIAVPQLAFEPGRVIAGQAGVTLYTVGTTKEVQLAGSDQAAQREDVVLAQQAGLSVPFANRLYVSVDGGMSDNARPALYGANYHVRLANRRSVAGPQLVRVVGKHCESGDIVVDRALLPADVRPGDVLAVAATGAYCFSLSSNYNWVPRPAVVALRGDSARLIVRGETVAELVGRSVAGEPVRFG